MVALPSLVLLLVFLLLLSLTLFSRGKRRFFGLMLLVYSGSIYLFSNCLLNAMMSLDQDYKIPKESSYCDFKLTGLAQDYGGNGKQWIYAKDNKNYYTAECPDSDKCSKDDLYYVITRKEAKSCQTFDETKASSWCVFHSK